MTDPAQKSAEQRAFVIPKPSASRPRPLAGPRPAATRPPALAGPPAVPVQVPAKVREDREPGADASRASARAALEKALQGVHLGCRDRQFLSRLVHWDKRNAASVASLLRRARLAGRGEAALTQRQHEIVMTALRDAAVYRASGADSIGCWDCDNCPGSQCADHARDADRAGAYADLAMQLSGRARDAELWQLTEISEYRRRTPSPPRPAARRAG